MKNNIAAFMVMKNDEFYVDMALQSVLPYVSGVYIQDQMSTDGTYEKVLSMTSNKILVERVDTGITNRFEKHYDEPKFRTMALKRTEELLSPDWILKLDADEIYTPYFFENLDRFLDSNININAVRVAGDRFISRTHRSIHPSGTEVSPTGVAFVDPHTQVWRANQGIYYITNPKMKGLFHPVLSPDPHPQYWLEGICNIHLHRTFGPKSFDFWAEGGDKFERKTPFHAPTMSPLWYASIFNMGSSEKVDFEWPEYVLKKWTEWGIW